jgi:hypothetical protein
MWNGMFNNAQGGSFHASQDGPLNSPDSFLHEIKKSLDVLQESHIKEVSSLKSVIMQLNRSHDTLTQERRKDTSLLHQELQHIRDNLSRLNLHLIPSSQSSAQTKQNGINLSLNVQDIAISDLASMPSNQDLSNTLNSSVGRPKSPSKNGQLEQPQKIIFFSTPSTIFDSGHTTVVFIYCDINTSSDRFQL